MSSYWTALEVVRMNACVLIIPPPPHDYPYYWIILDPKSKQDKVKVTNLKNLPKVQILEFWNKLYTIVDDTERTRFCPQTDRRTRWNQYSPFNFVELGYKHVKTTLLPFSERQKTWYDALYLPTLVNLGKCWISHKAITMMTSRYWS